MTGRLARHTQTINGSVFNDFSYSYTPRGNIAAIVEEGEITRTRQYSYDAIERLTEVAVPERPFEAEVYELDAEGNRLSSHLSAMHSTDAANRLTDDDNYTYVYDLNGNLTGKLAKAGTGLSDWTYRYDALDQLIEVSQDGAIIESYRYDAFGRRSLIRTAEGAGLTAEIGIINQGADRVLDIANDNAAGPSLAKRYTHGAAVDAPLQLESFDAAGTFEARYTYHPDHLGSIRYLTDFSGAIVNSYDYDSYGRPQFGITEVEQPFQYTGREWDIATGLYHYRARAYDAETGRFLQEDPIGFAAGDLNIYRYVGSNPINRTDPSGLFAGVETGAQQKTAVEQSVKYAVIGCRVGFLFTSVGSLVEGADTGTLTGIGRKGLNPCLGQAEFEPDPEDEEEDRCYRERQECHNLCNGLVMKSSAKRIKKIHSLTPLLWKCTNQCVFDKNCGGINYEPWGWDNAENYPFGTAKPWR